MLIDALEGYRIWSSSYDESPNPLLALEMRLLSERLSGIAGQNFLDAGSGTGRWMAWANLHGARVFGIDTCREMVLQAEAKPALAGRSALGHLRAIPLADGAIDVAVCSFTLAYVDSPRAAFRELARVARRVIVSDLHPEAARSGWTRSFRADEIYELKHFNYSAVDFDDAAAHAGLTPGWRMEARFGDPERSHFQRAGKEDAFEAVRRIPAVLITEWNKWSS